MPPKTSDDDKRSQFGFRLRAGGRVDIWNPYKCQPLFSLSPGSPRRNRCPNEPLLLQRGVGWVDHLNRLLSRQMHVVRFRLPVLTTSHLRLEMKVGVKKGAACHTPKRSRAFERYSFLHCGGYAWYPYVLPRAPYDLLLDTSSLGTGTRRVPVPGVL